MSKNRQSVLERINVRFYADDTDLMNWLRSIPEGGRNQAAKDLLRRGLEAEQRTLDQEAIRHVVREALGETQSALLERITNIRPLSSPDLDSDVVRRAVQEAMQDTADNKHPADNKDPIEETGVQECERLSTEALASIRRVVDAALQQHLDRLRINGSVQCEGNEGQNKGQNEDGDEDDDEAARVDALMDTLGKSLLR